MAGPLAVTPELEGTAAIGIVGVGTMGSALALNFLDRNVTVAIFNYETHVAEKFIAEHAPKYGPGKLVAGATYEDFAKLLQKPRKALILVTAGRATDIVIDNLSRVFEANDVIVDTGNAHFRDQTQRAAMLEAKGLRFLGMGISGGAEGARRGPAFFPGGTPSVWSDIQPIIEAASGKASDGLPCVTMCGRGGAGSCVKMYHNAGEYAVLQIWGEVCATFQGLGLVAAEIQAVLREWKRRGALDSYMLDITIEVVGAKDPLAQGGGLLLDSVADMIGSKGTGLWSVQEAMEVGCPVPSLAAAVISRQMSMARSQRMLNTTVLGDITQTPQISPGDRDKSQVIEDLYGATYVAIVASYAQMFQAIRAVDEAFDMDISRHLPRIISTFRSGCILQGAILEPMTKAFAHNPTLSNLVCAFREELQPHLSGARATCAMLALGGEPAPVIQASLDYVVTMTKETLRAAQVVSLQRDVFGRHGFQRLKEGEATSGDLFHAEWPEMLPDSTGRPRL